VGQRTARPEQRLEHERRAARGGRGEVRRDAPHEVVGDGVRFRLR